MTEEPILGEITAAGIHIEWAIRLMIDRSAFVPALTLAGAADSLLEKIAKDRGLERTAHSEIAQSLNAKGYGVSEEIGKSMNGARNFLKHGERKYFNATPSEIETSAIHETLRALLNLLWLTGEQPYEGRRFLLWVKARRPDLCLD